MRFRMLAAVAALSLIPSLAFAQSGQDTHHAPGAAPSAQEGHAPGMQPGQMPMMGPSMMGCPMMRMMGGAAQSTGDESVASLAFRAASDKMHRGMGIAHSGNVDVDFATAMIAHHQGAIDMAKIALAFGKDPDVKKLSEDIVRAQEGEIATMRDWLAKHGK
jgi:uncharacterized protein (DUF305 family)